MPDTVAQEVEQKFIHWKKVGQSWFHSRKALIFLVTFVVANVALFTGHLDADHWTSIIKWIVPSYIGANVVDGAVGAFSGKNPEDNS